MIFHPGGKDLPKFVLTPPPGYSLQVVPRAPRKAYLAQKADPSLSVKLHLTLLKYNSTFLH